MTPTMPTSLIEVCWVFDGWSCTVGTTTRFGYATAEAAAWAAWAHAPRMPALIYLRGARA